MRIDETRFAMNKPRILWAFWANKHGPWHKQPVKVIYNKDLDSWWSSGKDDDVVEKEGLVQYDHYVCFVHRDKKEVDKFIQGFMACRTLLKSFFD